MKKQYRGVDLHRNGFPVDTRAEDGSGASREGSKENVKGSAQTVRAKDEGSVAATAATSVWAPMFAAAAGPRRTRRRREAVERRYEKNG